VLVNRPGSGGFLEVLRALVQILIVVVVVVRHAYSTVTTAFIPAP
jgi:hypothetical protein